MAFSKWMDRCLCGGAATCSVMAILFVIGVPLFIAGVVMMWICGTDGETGGSVAGMVLLAVACFLVVAGLLVILAMCCMGPRILRITPGRKRRSHQANNKIYRPIEDQSSAALQSADSQPPPYQEIYTPFQPPHPAGKSSYPPQSSLAAGPSPPQNWAPFPYGQSQTTIGPVDRSVPVNSGYMHPVHHPCPPTAPPAGALVQHASPAVASAPPLPPYADAPPYDQAPPLPSKAGSR